MVSCFDQSNDNLQAGYLQHSQKQIIDNHLDFTSDYQVPDWLNCDFTMLRGFYYKTVFCLRWECSQNQQSKLTFISNQEMLSLNQKTIFQNFCFKRFKIKKIKFWFSAYQFNQIFWLLYIFAQTSNSSMNYHKLNFSSEVPEQEQSQIDNYFGQNSSQLNINRNMMVDNQQSLRLLFPKKNLQRIGYCTPPSQSSITSLPLHQQQGSKVSFRKHNPQQIKRKKQYIEQHLQMAIELPIGSQSVFQNQMFQYQLLNNHYKMLENVLSSPKINPLYKLNLTFQELDVNQTNHENRQNQIICSEKMNDSEEEALPFFGEKTPNFLQSELKLEEKSQVLQKIFQIPNICTKFYKTDTIVQNKQIFSQQMIELRNTLNIIKQKIKQSNVSDVISSSTHHQCKLCNEIFSNGRQLGGHMSRKHPNSSKQYKVKKQVYTTKKMERNRRMYFKKKTCSKADNQSYKERSSDDVVNEQF